MAYIEEQEHLLLEAPRFDLLQVHAGIYFKLNNFHTPDFGVDGISLARIND